MRGTSLFLRRKDTLLTSSWSMSMRKDVSSQQKRYRVHVQLVVLCLPKPCPLAPASLSMISIMSKMTCIVRLVRLICHDPI